MDNIIQLDILRVERHKPRKCTCDKPKFLVDTENREVTCECGMAHDAFEALLNLAERHEEINRSQRAMHEQKSIWVKQKPHSVLFKRLEQDYQHGKMLPYCPTCNYLIELDKLTSWGNAGFYLERQRQILAKEKGESKDN